LRGAPAESKPSRVPCSVPAVTQVRLAPVLATRWADASRGGRKAGVGQAAVRTRRPPDFPSVFPSPCRPAGGQAQKQRWPSRPKSAGPNMGDGCSPRTLSRLPALGALAVAGCRLPDATLHGMRRSRSHGGIAPAVAGRSLLSEASMPGSNLPCRESCAGQGADALARALSRRHRCHGDGPGLWPGVGPV